MGGGVGSWSLFSADELSGSRMLGIIREAMVASRRLLASCNLNARVKSYAKPTKQLTLVVQVVDKSRSNLGGSGVRHASGRALRLDQCKTR